MSTKLSPQSRMGVTPTSISTRSKNFRSGASVMSFGTTKSSLSRFSKKSQNSTTADAILISRATAQAAQAAKAILDTGGSELTALKTAKAAALSALMPEANENEMSHGIGSSFLRRRKLKRQADVVASMALASALVGTVDESSPAVDADMSAITEWDNETRSALMGLKILNEPTSRAETLSTEESSSTNNSEKSKPSTTDFIAKQLKLIPTIASSSFSERFRVEESSCSGSGSQSEEDPVLNDISHQLSTSTQGTQDPTSAGSQPPRHTRNTPRNQHKKKPEQLRQQHKKQNKRSHLRKETGCLGLAYSEDEMSVNSDMVSVVESSPPDSMFMAIFNAITCTPILSQRHRKRQPEPIEEEDDEFYETITFDDDDDDDDDEKLLALLDGTDEEEEAEEEDADEDDDHEEEDSGEEDNGIVDTKPRGAAPEAQVVSAALSPGSRGDVQASPTSDEILLDLLASATHSSGLRPPGASPQAVLTSPDRNTIELNVPNASDSVDELSMSGASSNGSFDKQDETANLYVQLVAPQRRSRRLSRGHKFTPSNEATTPKGPKGGMKIFRRRKWRNKGIAV